MEYMHRIKKMLCKELEEYADQNTLTVSDVEMIHKLTDTIKNLDKIEKLEGDDGYSGHYDDGSSYARRYVKRDSMGRYSRDGAKDRIMSKLGEMMDDADPNEREALKRAMREIERA